MPPWVLDAAQRLDPLYYGSWRSCTSREVQDVLTSPQRYVTFDVAHRLGLDLGEGQLHPGRSTPLLGRAGPWRGPITECRAGL